MSRKLAFVCCALLAACGGKEPADDTFTDLAGFDEKSDQFTGKMTIVGSMGYGETQGPFWHKAGKWSALKFLGSKGDQITVDVSSKNGDTVAWIVDKSSEILAYNDDWKGSTNSHIELTLKDGANTTFFIVVREYKRRAMKFSVTLNGKKAASYDAPCTMDADCTLVNAACCGAEFVAVRTDMADAFHQSLSCDPRLACPTVFPSDAMAQCQENKCVAVAAADIACGGHTLNPHQCPPRYVCEGKQMAYDAPGSCTKRCGGIAGFQCDSGDICVDDPNDDCDPNNGGADCMGVCRDSICSGLTAKCAAGYKWSQYDCTCVADDCRANGCGDGQWCSYCWGSFQCIPDGALC